MTTVYTDYYKAYDNKTMDISNVNFLVMLTDATYTPSPEHTLDDIFGIIISVPYVIVGDDIVTLGISEIIKKAEINIKDYMNLYPSEITIDKKYEDGRFIVLYNPSLNILCFCETINDML